VYGLLADDSPLIREAAATLAAKMLRAEADAKIMVGCRWKVRPALDDCLHD